MCHKGNIVLCGGTDSQEVDYCRAREMQNMVGRFISCRSLLRLLGFFVGINLWQVPGLILGGMGQTVMLERVRKQAVLVEAWLVASHEVQPLVNIVQVGLIDINSISIQSIKNKLIYFVTVSNQGSTRVVQVAVSVQLSCG